MKVYLLRHAKAEPGYPDAGRRLAGKGRLDAERLGSFLRGKEDFRPGEAWVSPLVRAGETAGIFLQALNPEGRGPLVERTEDLLEPERDPKPIIESLGGMGRNVLLVGHNPNLEILFSLLVSGQRSGARIHLKTCVLVCLEWLPWAAPGVSGTCSLRWILDPRLI